MYVFIDSSFVLLEKIWNNILSLFETVQMSYIIRVFNRIVAHDGFQKNLTNILHLFVFTCPSRTLWSFEPDLTHLPNLRYLFNAKTSTEDI
jgi:hypothetical protein